MRVEYIYENESFDGSELLAMVMRNEPMIFGCNFVTAPGEPIQVACIRHEEGKTITAHHHRKKIAPSSQGYGEVIVIKRGCVECIIYDTNDKPKQTITLSVGDVLITLTGGHAFKMLTESEMIEVRKGPYHTLTDKVRF